ncbi:hypothetical protein SPI1_52 [Skermania phage SPI1]|nr:hypothetical protein SPI1_52 [Skermania phage SPI1]
MRVLGIDPSLTSTGLAILDTGTRWWTATTIPSAAPKTPTTTASFVRLEGIRDRLSTWVDGAISDEYVGISCVVIEAPAYSRTAGMSHERAGLWWLLYAWARDYLTRVSGEDGRLVVVLPNLRAKYATGRGNAAKDVVMLASAKRYPDADITGNDIADAVLLAAIGARMMGEAVDDPLSAAQLSALKTLRVESPGYSA